MFKKKIHTQEKIHDLIAHRWSGVAFDSAKLLEKNIITSLFEAAQWAPSCYGDQPWRFIAFDKATDEKAWEAALSCIVPGNQSWAQNAPLLILANADTILSKTGKQNRWGEYDTGAATLNLSLQAAELGLMVHQMGGFDADKAIELFNIPAQYTPMSFIAVGYQLAETDIPEEIKQREYSERSRNPLSVNVFSGVWDTPYST